MVADRLAEGTKHTIIADELDISFQTITNYLRHPEFSSYVDNLVLTFGVATKAGMVLEAKRMLRSKIKDYENCGDRSTALEYMKFLSDLIGLNEAVEEKRAIRIVVE